MEHSKNKGNNGFQNPHAEEFEQLEFSRSLMAPPPIPARLSFIERPEDAVDPDDPSCFRPSAPLSRRRPHPQALSSQDSPLPPASAAFEWNTTPLFHNSMTMVDTTDMTDIAGVFATSEFQDDFIFNGLQPGFNASENYFSDLFPDMSSSHEYDHNSYSYPAFDLNSGFDINVSGDASATALTTSMEFPITHVNPENLMMPMASTTPLAIMTSVAPTAAMEMRAPMAPMAPQASHDDPDQWLSHQSAYDTGNSNNSIPDSSHENAHMISDTRTSATPPPKVEEFDPFGDGFEPESMQDNDADGEQDSNSLHEEVENSFLTQDVDNFLDEYQEESELYLNAIPQTVSKTPQTPRIQKADCKGKDKGKVTEAPAIKEERTESIVSPQLENIVPSAYRDAIMPALFQARPENLRLVNPDFILEEMPRNALSYNTWRETLRLFPENGHPLMDPINRPPHLSLLYGRSANKSSKMLPERLDADGHVVNSIFDRGMKDIWQLPLMIPPTIEGSWITYWMTKVPGLRFSDIVDRIDHNNPDFEARVASANAEGKKEMADNERNRLSIVAQRWRQYDGGMFDLRHEAGKAPAVFATKVAKRRIHPFLILHNIIWPMHWAPSSKHMPRRSGHWFMQQEEQSPFYEVPPVTEPPELLRWVYRHAGFRVPTLEDYNRVEAMYFLGYNPYQPLGEETREVDPDWLETCYTSILPRISVMERNNILRKIGFTTDLMDDLSTMPRPQMAGVPFGASRAHVPKRKRDSSEATPARTKASKSTSSASAPKRRATEPTRSRGSVAAAAVATLEASPEPDTPKEQEDTWTAFGEGWGLDDSLDDGELDSLFG